MTDNNSLNFLWEFSPIFVSETPHCKALGIEFISVDIGRATLKLPYSHKLVGNSKNRIVHGGAVTGLLDHASGLAAISGLDPISMVATLNLSIDYMRAAEPGKDIIAQADCYKATRSIAFTRAVAHTGDIDDPIAISQATFMPISPISDLELPLNLNGLTKTISSDKSAS